MAGLFGPSKQTSTSRVELPEWANAGLQKTADRALSLYERPYQAYGGQRTAGLSGLTAQGAEAVQGAAGYQPGTVTPAMVAPGSVTPGSLAGRDLSAYTDPHQQQVIDAALGDIDRSTRIAQAGRAAGGVQAAGFGGFGDRSAVAGAEIERAGIDAKARTAAGLRSAGFQRAQDMAVADINRDLQGQTTNLQAGLQAGLANQQATMGAQQFNVSAGLQGAQQRTQAGLTLAGLGEQERAVRQQGLDAAYQEFAAGRDDPFLKTQWAAGVIGGNASPYAGNVSQTTPGPSLFSQLTGAATAGAGIYNLLSDPDDKTDRKRLGTDPATGLGIWAYRYKGDGKGSPKVVGVMADEVAKRFPHLVREVNGHRVVDMAGLAALAGQGGESQGLADGGMPFQRVQLMPSLRRPRRWAAEEEEVWPLRGGGSFEGGLRRPINMNAIGGAQRRRLQAGWAAEDRPYPQIIEGVAEAVPMTDAWTGTPAVAGMGAGGPSFGGEQDHAGLPWGGPVFRGEADGEVPWGGAAAGEGGERFAPGSVRPDFAGEGVAGGQTPRLAPEFAGEGAAGGPTAAMSPAVRAALARLRPRGRPGVGGPVFPGEVAALPARSEAGPDAVAAAEQPQAVQTAAPGGATPAADDRGWLRRFTDRLVDPEHAGSVALLQAGLGMMASRNPNWAGAIGEGALLGLQSAERARPFVRQRRNQQELQELIRSVPEVAPAIAPRRAPVGRAASTPVRMTSEAVPAEGGGVAIPEALRPVFDEASRETGIPVPVLAAVAQQESGFDQARRGGAGEIGIMQVLPSTARRPGFGMEGVDPAALSDPAENIRFGARYLRARAGDGVDWNNPESRAAAWRAYNGGGDPNYVENVQRWMPRAAAPAASRGAAPEGGAAPAAARGTEAAEAEPVVQVGGRAFTRSQLLGMAASAPDNEAVQRFVGMALPVINQEMARREAAADRREARAENADLRREIAGRNREPMPTELSRLISERDALPAGDPRRASYDAAIRRSSGEAAAERFTPAQMVQLRRDASNAARQEAAGLDFNTEAERTGWIAHQARRLLAEWGVDEAAGGGRGGGAVSAPLGAPGPGAAVSGEPDDAVADNGARIRPRGRARSLSDRARTDLGRAGEALASFNVLQGSWEDDYGGYGFERLGDAANFIARHTPGESPRADWWSQYQERKNLIRNQLFGSALTATEKAEFDKASINPGMSAEAIRTNLARQQRAAQRAARRLATSLRAAGYPAEEVEAALGMPIPEDAPEPVPQQRRGGGDRTGDRAPPGTRPPPPPRAGDRPSLDSFMP